MLVERKDHFEEDGSIGYIDSIFDSSNILLTIFFPKLKRLYIGFNRGGVYRYSNFSQEDYDKFELAESQGKHFHKEIKNNSNFIFNKEFNLLPHEIEDAKKKIIEYKKNLNINETNN